MLEELRNIAIRFQIDPIETVGHAAKLESVIKVLTNIGISFNNFLEIEFQKTPKFKQILSEKPEVLKLLKDDLNLLIVDLKFSSFEAALAPNFISNDLLIFENEITNWKQTAYSNYKNNVIYGNFEDSKYLNEVQTKYSEIERQKIYQPLFNSLGSNKEYFVNLKGEKNNILKKFKQPEKEFVKKYYYQSQKIEKAQKEYGTYNIYVKAIKQNGEIDVRKNDIKKLLYIEEIEHDTYPYHPKLIKFDDKIYSLNQKLECLVEYHEDVYLIHNELLEITAWGDTREEAEEAFNFSFHSTYLNYANELNSNLSKEAIEIKKKISSLVEATYYETKKN